MRVDADEVKTLGIDLSHAPNRMQRRAPRVLRRGAKIVETYLREEASGHRYLPHLAETVDSGPVGPLAYEIGFKKGGQGSLAHLLVDGSVNNGPVFSNTAPLRRALPEIERDLARKGEDAVLGGAE